MILKTTLLGKTYTFRDVKDVLAKALGTQLALRLGRETTILCIDRVRLGEGDYLDVAAPIGPAMPVVVKTLVLER